MAIRFTPWSWFDILIVSIDLNFWLRSKSRQLQCSRRLQSHETEDTWRTKYTLSSLNRVLVKNVQDPVAHLLLRKWNTAGEACASGFIGTLNPSIPDCFREKEIAREFPDR